MIQTQTGEPRKFLPPCVNADNSATTCSPANAEAAQLYRENMKEYVRRVKLTVEESWLDPGEEEEANKP